MSLVGVKVISIKVLAKGINIDLATIRVKVFEGVLHMVVHVGEDVAVLRSSRKLKACEKRCTVVYVKDNDRVK